MFEVAEYFLKNFDFYKSFFFEGEIDMEAYAKKVKTHLWGGDCEISIISKIFSINIYVFEVITNNQEYDLKLYKEYIFNDNQSN